MSHTTVIIVLTTIISAYAFNNPKLFKQWMFNAYMIKHHGQFYRFLTSGFLHSGWVHLAFNMLTLYFLGVYVESFFDYEFEPYGKLVFWALYLSSIVISSIPSFLKHKDHEFYNSIGASGGVSAIVFVFILLNPVTTLWIFGLIPIPGFILGILYVWYSVRMSKRGGDNINHDAHLWGAIYGALFLIALRPGIVTFFIREIGNFRLFQ